MLNVSKEKNGSVFEIYQFTGCRFLIENGKWKILMEKVEYALLRKVISLICSPLMEGGLKKL